MLSWASIVYGAALSAIVAGAALTALARPRQPAVILTGALAAAAGPLGWNATLRATPASQFFTDAPCGCRRPAGKTPLRRIALATATVLLGVGPLAAAPARRSIGLAVRTATASSRPARPGSGSRSSAAASRPGHSGSGPSNTLPDRSLAASAAKTSNPRTPATSNR